MAEHGGAMVVYGNGAGQELATGRSADGVEDFLAVGTRFYQEQRLWNKPEEILKYAQREWRRINPNFLVDPYHNCTPKCSLRPVRATLYCQTTGATDSMLTMLGAPAAGDPEKYHMCFPDHCKHLKRHHYCEGKVCCHAIVYGRDHVKPLPNLWFCRVTETVHACGRACTATRTRRPPDYHLVCTLTGAVLEGMICDDNEYNLNKAAYMTVAGREKLQPGMQQPAPPPRRKTRREIRMDEWDNPLLIAAIHELAVTIFDELVFSEPRQVLEAAGIFSAYEEAYDGLVVATRRRRAATAAANAARRSRRRGGGGAPLQPLGARAAARDTSSRTSPGARGGEGGGAPPGEAPALIVLPEAFDGYYAAYPRSEYFLTVPARPSVAQYIDESLAAVSARLVGQSLPHAADCPGDAEAGAAAGCAGCVVAHGTARRRAVLRGVVERHHRAAGTAASRVLTWESDEWQARRASILDTVGRVVTRIWRNLVRFSAVTKDTRFCAYERYVLAIIYLLRAEFSISVGGAEPPSPPPMLRLEGPDGGRGGGVLFLEGGGSASSPQPPPSDSGGGRGAEPPPPPPARRIVVVPRLVATELLPAENMLMYYPVAKPGLQNRQTMTAAIAGIKDALYVVAAAGHLADLEIVVDDLVGTTPPAPPWRP